METGATSIEHILAHELSVNRQQVWAAIKLLDSGATVPFIARYRKEATGGLTDTHLRMLSDRLEYLRDLEKRRIDIFQSIEEQGKMTESLKNAIQNCCTKSELEDLYLPFRQKKGSKAETAKAMGLEPLAEALLRDPGLDPQTTARAFVNPDKAVPDTATALAGAREILMERFADDGELLATLRQKFWTSVYIHSTPAKTSKRPEGAENFIDYFNFREMISKIPSHRVLAILRGRRENILQISFLTEGYADYSDSREEKDAEYLELIFRRFNITNRRRPADAWLVETVKTCWKYKIRLRIEIDMLTRLRESAEEEAIRVFSENLKNLLLAAPAGPRITLGLDPGFRTGVKMAAVDKTGHVLEIAVIYPHPPQDEWGQSIETLKNLIKKHVVELVAIGNGTASRQTDKLVSEVLRQIPELKTQKIVVSEAGASVYSASELASVELPGMDVSFRGAVSIARRLQDPLAELVKIDPKSIGVGQYQHDVNQARLAKMLRSVVEDCVNAVGVDANTASVSLLSYVSGLTKRVAENVVARRAAEGLFKNRLEFLKIPDFGPRTYEQAAGFLRVIGGDNPLDGSAVHPESYPVVQRILESSGKSIKDVMGNTRFLSSLKPQQFVDETFGEPTVLDILVELDKPGRDPRPEFKTVAYREDITEIEDLKPGMTLNGTVTNVANFGAFVDIGVHTDGLVHVSELADEFVRDPHEVIKTGQTVRVRVLEVDLARKRIALSLRPQRQHRKNLIESKTVSGG